MLLLIRLLIELPWETRRIPSKVFWLWKILTASTIFWCWEKILNASPVKIGNSRYKWLFHRGAAFQPWAWRDLWGETCAQHWKEQKQNWTMPATSTFFIQVPSERPFLKEGFAKTLSCSKTNLGDTFLRKAYLDDCHLAQHSSHCSLHWVPLNSEVHPQDPYSWGSPYALGSQVETWFCEGPDIK